MEVGSKFSGRFDVKGLRKNYKYFYGFIFYIYIRAACGAFSYTLIFHFSFVSIALDVEALDRRHSNLNCLSSSVSEALDVEALLLRKYNLSSVSSFVSSDMFFLILFASEVHRLKFVFLFLGLLRREPLKRKKRDN